MTETILQMCNITHSLFIHGHYSFFHFRGHYSVHFLGHYFFHFLFLGDRSLYLVTSLNTWVSTPPVVSTGWIPSGCTCLGVPAHHVCSTYVSASQVQPPGPGCYVAQLITSCPINLSVGQPCIHFICPSFISNYPHQYPKSHNLRLHQYPLHDTKITSI